jgi:hypothetical protein
MNIVLVIYLIPMIDLLKGFCTLTCVIGVPLCLILALIDIVEFEGEVVNATKKWAIGIFLPLLLMALILPSEKTMYLMAGAKCLQDSIIPKKIELIISKKLDEYLLEDNKDKK